MTSVIFKFKPTLMTTINKQDILIYGHVMMMMILARAASAGLLPKVLQQGVTELSGSRGKRAASRVSPGLGLRAFHIFRSGRRLWRGTVEVPRAASKSVSGYLQSTVARPGYGLRSSNRPTFTLKERCVARASGRGGWPGCVAAIVSKSPEGGA